jgi:hypothetical protein
MNSPENWRWTLRQLPRFRTYPSYVAESVAPSYIDSLIVLHAEGRSVAGFALPLQTKPYQDPAGSAKLIPSFKVYYTDLTHSVQPINVSD